MPDDILTTAQAARLLGVSLRTAQLWIEGGAIPSWKTPGGHRRVRRPDVLKLIHATAPGGNDGLPAADVQLPTPSNVAGYPYPILQNEAQRALAVENTGLIDTPPEAPFDRFTWLASEFLAMPISFVTLLTKQHQWFKSRHGMEIVNTPREVAFCNYTILQTQVLSVNDLGLDARFARNPGVTGAPHFRFYAGAPLYDEQGYALGSLCVMDTRPRSIGPQQESVLLALAAMTTTEIRLRGAQRLLRQSNRPSGAHA